MGIRAKGEKNGRIELQADTRCPRRFWIVQDESIDHFQFDKCLFLQCCIIGSLLAGIAFVTVLILWLSHLPTTTTSTSTSTSTSTTTTTTTTTATTSTTSTTSSTSSTSTTLTTTTTPSPPCPPTAVNSGNLLYWNGSRNTSNTCYSYLWQASATGPMNLTFEFRHDPDYWYLDEVSIYHGVTQLLGNGDFEMGTLSPWRVISPSPRCVAGAGRLSNSTRCFDGRFCFVDGCKNASNFLTQQFDAIAGETYIISFWLFLNSLGSIAFVNVTLS